MARQDIDPEEFFSHVGLLYRVVHALGSPELLWTPARVPQFPLRSAEAWSPPAIAFAGRVAEEIPEDADWIAGLLPTMQSGAQKILDGQPPENLTLGEVSHFNTACLWWLANADGELSAPRTVDGHVLPGSPTGLLKACAALLDLDVPEGDRAYTPEWWTLAIEAAAAILASPAPALNTEQQRALHYLVAQWDQSPVADALSASMKRASGCSAACLLLGILVLVASRIRSR